MKERLQVPTPGNLNSGLVSFQGALGMKKLFALGIATAAFASLGSIASTTPVQAFGWGCGGSCGCGGAAYYRSAYYGGGVYRRGIYRRAGVRRVGVRAAGVRARRR